MSNRCAEVFGEIVRRINEAVADCDVTYPEYQAAKEWLIEVGQAGEWPLLLDVFVEHAVEEQANKGRPGSEGTIMGPFYLPDAPVLEPPYELPRRPDEQGAPLVMSGRVASADGTPLPGAVLDVWHADSNGHYSGFSDIPEGILRGKVVADGEGRFLFRTIVPGCYTIPHDGPTGRLIAACGRLPWRPAHLHLLVSAQGHELLTTQLYLAGSDHIGDDVASAVKDSLIVRPERRGDHLHFDYEFRLAPVRTPAMLA
jgi:catechol 1,2-dioxygenase